MVGTAGDETGGGGAEAGEVDEGEEKEEEFLEGAG